MVCRPIWRSPESAKRKHVESRVGDAALPAPMADLEEGEIEEGELPSEEPEVINLCMLTLVYEKYHVRYVACYFCSISPKVACMLTPATPQAPQEQLQATPRLPSEETATPLEDTSLSGSAFGRDERSSVVRPALAKQHAAQILDSRSAPAPAQHELRSRGSAGAFFRPGLLEALPTARVPLLSTSIPLSDRCLPTSCDHDIAPFERPMYSCRHLEGFNSTVASQWC